MKLNEGANAPDLMSYLILIGGKLILNVVPALIDEHVREVPVVLDALPVVLDLHSWVEHVLLLLWVKLYSIEGVVEGLHGCHEFLAVIVS